jgi:tetratricopeptide (TPR) repeat protein
MKYRILRLSPIPFVALLLAIAPTLPLAAQMPDGVPVTEDYQAWADGSHDGMLQPVEIGELMKAFFRFLGGPHPANNPLDTLFDQNRDRKIGPDEIDHVWMDIILPRLQRLLPTNPEAARLVDLNDDGRLAPDEAHLVVEYLRNPASLQPHKASPPVDTRADANRDGRITADEAAGFREQIVRAAVLLPPEVGLPGGQWVIERRFLDVLADVNDSGELEPEEERWREAALGGPHTAKTAIDKRLDTNHNGKVEQAEIDSALNTQRNQDERMAAEQKAPEAATAQPTAQKPAAPSPQAIAAPAAASAPATTAAAAGTSTGTAAASAGVTLEQVSIDEIFPVFRSYYDDHPIGTAMLKNGGPTALENVKVELGLAKYMDAKKPCTAPTTIAAGSSGKVELTAVFNDEVLKISEGTKALATVTVSYTTGGKPVSQDFVQTVQFLKLNAMTWDDDDRAAAFVTANDPIVQQFRSAVVTNVDKAVTAVDRNLRTGMALHQTLVKYGLKYWTDPNTAYEAVTKTKSAVDSLQFPVQTIQLKTGDCDDLSILAAALLESSSVESAFITVPGHIFVAFALAMKPDEAKKTFVKPDDLIFANEKAWVPWEITALSGGFLKAWETGAQEWRASTAKGVAEFHPVQAAWKKYKPVASPTSPTGVTLPSEADWTKAYTEEVKTFINQQIATQVQKLQADIKSNPTKYEYVNKLGVLYARYGLAAEAEKEFLKLDKQDYVPALINLGNLAFLKPDMKTALGYYGRACKKESTNAKALLGSARANHEQENYGAAQEAYTSLKKVDPTLASQYAYLELQGTEADQAAKAGNVIDKVEWEEK